MELGDARDCLNGTDTQAEYAAAACTCSRVDGFRIKRTTCPVHAADDHQVQRDPSVVAWKGLFHPGGMVTPPPPVDLLMDDTIEMPAVLPLPILVPPNIMLGED